MSQEHLVPPGNAQRHTGLHWLENDLGEPVALQWNPGTRTWTHSNCHATWNSETFDTKGWTYLAPIPLPEISVHKE